MNPTEEFEINKLRQTTKTYKRCTDSQTTSQNHRHMFSQQSKSYNAFTQRAKVTQNTSPRHVERDCDAADIPKRLVSSDRSCFQMSFQVSNLFPLWCRLSIEDSSSSKQVCLLKWLLLQTKRHLQEEKHFFQIKKKNSAISFPSRDSSDSYPPLLKNWRFVSSRWFPIVDTGGLFNNEFMSSKLKLSQSTNGLSDKPTGKVAINKAATVNQSCGKSGINKWLVGKSFSSNLYSVMRNFPDRFRVNNSNIGKAGFSQRSEWAFPDFVPRIQQRKSSVAKSETMLQETEMQSRTKQSLLSAEHGRVIAHCPRNATAMSWEILTKRTTAQINRSGFSVVGPAANKMLLTLFKKLPFLSSCFPPFIIHTVFCNDFTWGYSSFVKWNTAIHFIF